MSGIRRPKTAGPCGGGLTFRQQQRQQPGDADCDMPTAAAVARLARRSGSQMSLRSGEDACWPQYVPIRRVPSAMKRNMEIQTDASPLPPAMGLSRGQQVPMRAATPRDPPAAVSGGGALFYPYYVPGLQDAGQQPYVLLSPWQLPGYQNLPVLDPAQLKLLDPIVRSRRAEAGVAHPLDGAPIYRSGRNGSCWRHIKHCIGNLGNNIMFIDGHVKEEDCRRFPPHGYPGMSVHSRLAPKAPPRIPLGFPAGLAAGGVSGGSGGGTRHSTLAQERARAGNKYWFEDKTPAPLTPTTIQGKIMKSGSAY